MAAVLTHYETMKIKATLDPGCPDYENTYSNTGNSGVYVQAAHECTNSAPGPECPIELTAAGWGGAFVTGDLRYRTWEVAGSDVDELELTAASLRRHMEMTGPIDTKRLARPCDTGP